MATGVEKAVAILIIILLAFFMVPVLLPMFNVDPSVGFILMIMFIIGVIAFPIAIWKQKS